MAAGYDGSIKIETKIDTTGIERDAKSVRAQVSKLAAEYRKQGMNASDAFKKAWSEIERTSKQTNQSIRSDVAATGDSIQKSANNLNTSISAQIKNGLSGITQALKGMAAAVGVAFGVSALVNFGKEAVNIASDIAEVQNVVDTAFGDMAYMAEDFASRAIEQFGMSELAAKRTASTYMAMSTGLGMAGDAAAKMAIDVAGLTGDVASFYNMSQELAATKLKSIWTGETETLKDLGIVMTQANLQQYAYANGIDKLISEMTQAEQVQLRYMFVTDQLSIAQGDFAKTSASWANQVRVLTERWKEFMGYMGNSLITVLTPVLQFLNQIVAAMINFAKTFSAVVGALFGEQAQDQKDVSSSADQAAKSESKLAAATGKAGEAAKKAGKEAKQSLAAFDDLNVLSKESSSGTGSESSMDSGIGSAIDMPQIPSGGMLFDNIELSPKVQEIIDNLKSMFGNLATEINTALEPVKKWFETDFQEFLQTASDSAGEIFSGLSESIQMVFSDIWELAIKPLTAKMSETLLPTLSQLCSEVVTTYATMFNEIKSVFDEVWQTGIAPAISTITGILEDLMDSISQAWEKWGKPIFDNVRLAITQIGEIASSVWENFLKPVWDNFMESVDWLWTNHLQPFVDNFLDFVGELVNGALTIFNNVILPIIHWLVDMLGPAFATVFNTVFNTVSSVIAAIIDIINGFISTLKGIIQFIVAVFTADWDKAWEGLTNVIRGTFDTIKGIVNGFVNIIIDGINGFLGLIESAINFIIRSLNKISFDLPDWIPGIGGKTFGINIPEVKIGKIPKLATGAVIPPNAEFLAVLGDQKRGRNIEAPEGLLRQLIREELENAQEEISVNMPVYLDGEEIYRNQQKVAWRKGRNLIKGGAY